jgi:hypothetical protein
VSSLDGGGSARRTPLPFELSAEAKAYLAEFVRNHASDDASDVVCYLTCAGGYSYAEPSGQTVECYEGPHFGFAGDSRDRLDDVFEFDLDGAPLFVDKYALDQLKKKRLVLERVDVGFPDPSSRQKESLIAEPLDVTIPVRWRFAELAHGKEEADRRREVSSAIEAWWRAFEATTADLDRHFRNEKAWDLAGWMDEHLGAIDPRIMWEYGPAAHGGGHRLVLTPESARFLRPLVGEILRRAPRIAGWEFYPHRFPESVEMARVSVEARAHQNLGEAGVRVLDGRHGRIDLVFVHADGAKITDEAAFVAAESLVGEQILDEWIGAILVEPPKSNGGRDVTQYLSMRVVFGPLFASPLEESLGALNVFERRQSVGC